METTKITLRTLKTFINKNRENLYINCKSSFDGMVDCVMPVENSGFMEAKIDPLESTRDNTLGVRGAWFVFQSRDYFTTYDDGTYTGYEISNCCGHFILAIPKGLAPVDPDETPKQKEIRLLTELYKMHGYFADEFYAGDLDKMTSNIESDFPVFMNTAPDNRYQSEKTQRESSDNAYNELWKKHDACLTSLESLERVNAEMKEKLDRILDSFVTRNWEQSPYTLDYTFFSEREIITAKLNNNVTLDAEEIKFVQHLMNK